MKKSVSKLMALVMALLLSISCAVAASANPIDNAKTAAGAVVAGKAITDAQNAVTPIAAGALFQLEIGNPILGMAIRNIDFPESAKTPVTSTTLPVDAVPETPFTEKPNTQKFQNYIFIDGQTK